MFLSVAIDAPLRRTFDYRCPASIDPKRIRPGTRIWVPFGRRRVVGVLLEYRDQSEVSAAKLKPALELIDSEATFDAALLHLLRWSADYYRHPIGEVFAAALPAALREGTPLQEEEFLWRLTSNGREGGVSSVGARATKQREVLAFLAERDSASLDVLTSAVNMSREVLRQLADRGLIEQFSQPVRAMDAVPTSNTALVLNEHQHEAVERVRATFGSFASHLLYGVTGSGKTEVYLHLIDEVLRRGEQALVLVPEIGLTPQLLNRFQSRFNARIGVMHSGLNESDRLSAWRSAREGTASIIIGDTFCNFCAARPPRTDRRR